MKWSRRQFPLLLPALAAAQTPGQSAAPAGVQDTVLYRYENLEARRSGTITTRQMVHGTTRTGFLVDMHETELGAGEAPHPPHKHVHEEMLLIREGLLEVTAGGRTMRLGAGSVGYFASNQEHGWRNVGTGTARYFVLALGDDKA